MSSEITVNLLDKKRSDCERRIGKMQNNRKLLGFVLMFLVVAESIAFTSGVNILIHTINVDATVSEALSSTTLNLDFSGMPGETIVESISVNNGASVPLGVFISWNEDTNLNGVNYTTDMPQTVTLAPGANSVDVSFTYTNDTVTGDVNGTVTLERTA